MSRSAVGPALVIVALAGAVWSEPGRAQTSDALTAEVPAADTFGTDAFKPSTPRDVRLPRLEVPDPATRTKRPAPGVDRSSLLNQTIELSDDHDRRTLAREQSAWGRLSGSLCVGCGGETRRPGRVVYVDPIAVLNAKPTSRVTVTRVAETAPKPTLVSTPARAPAARPSALLVAARPAAGTAAGVTARPVADITTAALPPRKVRPSHANRVQLARR
ncbi:MAG: hypothetical protein INR70_29280, partial [Parafilimonas terrae]|nr:hypothetical protein [Parafilimonas terrae]